MVSEMRNSRQDARGKITEKINGMTSHSSNQTKMNHLAKMTDFSAPFYDLYFKLGLSHESDFREKVVDLMDLAGDESVLDVGCGTGTLTSMVAERMSEKGSVFGVDLSPRMIDMAEKKACKQRNQIEYRVASSLALPFDNKTFDVVVTSLVYHHLMSLAERAKTLSESWRVLKTEGRYIAAEFTKFTAGNLLITHDSLIRRIGLFSLRLLDGNGFHVVEKLKTSKGIMIISARKLR